jgi:hypothetical protein
MVEGRETLFGPSEVGCVEAHLLYQLKAALLTLLQLEL